MKFSIGNKVRITREFVCVDKSEDFPGVGTRVVGDRVETDVKVGDRGYVYAKDDGKYQVLMETGDYAGIITNVDPDGVEVE